MVLSSKTPQILGSPEHSTKASDFTGQAWPESITQKAQNSLGKWAPPSVSHPVTLISPDARRPLEGLPIVFFWRQLHSSCFEQLWNKRPVSKGNISKSSHSRKTSHVKGLSLGIGNEGLKTPEWAHEPHHSSLNLKSLRLKLMIPLPLLPKCQDYRHVQPHLSWYIPF